MDKVQKSIITNPLNYWQKLYRILQMNVHIYNCSDCIDIYVRNVQTASKIDHLHEYMT